MFINPQRLPMARNDHKGLIPTDLVVEILKRLPAKSIAKFFFVQKSLKR